MALAPRNLKGLQALGCSACRGLWLAAPQLESGLRALAASSAVKADTVAFERKASGPPPSAAADCPVCRAPMSFLNYGYDSNVFLQNCLSCRAYWIRDDQLYALAAYVKGEAKYAPDEASLAQLAAGESAREQRQTAFRWGAAMLWGSVLPTGTSVPVSRRCWLVGTLIALNVLVFLLQPRAGPGANAFFRLFGLTPSGVRAGQYWRFLTHMFVHEGPLHLGFNMYFLWLFGRNIEDDLGRPAFLGLYLVAGLMGALFHLAAYGSVEASLIGASGAISGLLGAFYARFPRAGIRVRLLQLGGDPEEVPAHFFLGLWFLQQLGRVFLAGGAGGVAFLAHVGGFIAGYLAVSPRPAPAPAS